MKNKLKARLAAGQVAIGCQMRYGTPAIVELFGLAGFDWLLLDTEHAPQTPTGIQQQLQAAGCTDTTTLVRVHQNDPDLIKLYLDMGAMGIVVPFINTPEEAKKGASACRYPPRGIRGFGPHRAYGYGTVAMREYYDTFDDEVVFFPIIESAEAIDNIDGIYAVEGVDACIIGPVDLAISLGVPFDFECDVFLAAQRKVAAAAQRAGKPACMGLPGSPQEGAGDKAKQLVEEGFSLILAGGDEPFLNVMCKTVTASLAACKELQWKS